MAVIMFGKYLEKKLVELHHEPSGAVIITDAPKDNEGMGSAFSPTDMVTGALGSCMLTVMANVAARRNIPLDGTHFRVEKHMIDSPRRIGKILLEFHLPRAIEDESRIILERAALSCPVHHSLRADIETPIEFHYDV